MVVQIPSDMRAVMLEGSHRARLVADTFYDGRPTLTGLRLLGDGQITGRHDGTVQTTGRCTIESNEQTLDGVGNTIAPSQAIDALATYGQEIVISRQVYLGTQLIGAQSLGRFRITEVPNIEQTAQKLRGSRLVTSTSVSVSFADQLERIEADDFPTLQSPQLGGTVWSEIRRFSPVPVVQTLTDPIVATATIYDDKRSTTIEKLLSIANGVPHITRSGALSGRLADPFSVAVTPLDLTGTIKPLSRSMSNDFHNCVVVTTTINGTEQVIAQAQILAGPLRVDGPAGRRTYKRSAGLATTRAAAQALADSILLAETQRRTRIVRVTALPNVSLELGDAVTVTDPASGVRETGMVAGLSWPMNPTQLMTIDVETRVAA